MQFKFHSARFFGVLGFWIGVAIFTLSFNATSNITGFAVVNDTWKVGCSLLGLLCVVGGVVLFISSGRGEIQESNLVELIETSRFKRAAKKHLSQARKAAQKIGTGTGKEEKLKDGRGYAIRAQGGDRVIFDYSKDRTKAELLDYVMGHKYRN
jgi:hypothetical protein